MALKSDGLSKLVLTAYADGNFSDRAPVDPNPITVGINPEGYSRALSSVYTAEGAAGSTGRSISFNRQGGETLRLAFVFDNTGAVPEAPDRPVHVQVDDLRRLAMDIHGAIHRPNFVKLVWGTLLFKGVMTALDVDYTLFDGGGTPLRARVAAAFSGYQENLQARSAQKRSSPDLTHAVEVQAGDTLPLLCHRVYGDGRWYAAVARHNGLDDFRSLVPGDTLLFPPLTGAVSPAGVVPPAGGSA